MTKALKASEYGLKPHYKVRIVISGAILHLASWDQPQVAEGPGGAVAGVEASWIDDPGYGDTAGFVDWAAVDAVTWRWSE
jgi:hypothetical protein